MDTHCAPYFANLFLDKFETKALKKSPHKPSHYIRYILMINGLSGRMEKNNLYNC